MAQSSLILLTIAFAINAHCMLIPHDVEVLDGYEFDGPPEIYPDETYFEAKALADSLLLKAIRNKRSYHVLPSAGLRSHFQIESLSPVEQNKHNHVLDTHPDNKIRSRRAINENESRPIDTIEDTDNEPPQALPIPEKQVGPEYYTKGNWNVQTFNTDYSGNSPKSDSDDVDSVPDATVNEGIKSRQPRVNFITQPKKEANGEERSSKDRLSGLMTKLTPTITKPRYEKVETTVPESYPSRSYDQYLRRYDRYDDDYINYNNYNYNRYDPYDDYYVHRRRYDPYDSYSPRTPTYPEEYYSYPDRRYDVPEPREYRQLYSNDIYERPTTYHPPYEQQTPTRRRNRIIYYAHLPEVVRAPPTVDLTYRHTRDHRFDSYYPPFNSYQIEGTRINGPKTSGDFVKRDKKDYRQYETGSKAALIRSEKNGRD